MLITPLYFMLMGSSFRIDPFIMVLVAELDLYVGGILVQDLVLSTLVR